jgi:hypothetical protein
MQLLSALEQMVETLWLAIGAAAVFFIIGMAVHAATRVLKRSRARLRA